MFKVIDTRTGEDVTDQDRYRLMPIGLLQLYSTKLESWVTAERFYKAIFDKPKVKPLEWRNDRHHHYSDIF